MLVRSHLRVSFPVPVFGLSLFTQLLIHPCCPGLKGCSSRCGCLKKWEKKVPKKIPVQAVNAYIQVMYGISENSTLFFNCFAYIVKKRLTFMIKVPSKQLGRHLSGALAVPRGLVVWPEKHSLRGRCCVHAYFGDSFPWHLKGNHITNVFRVSFELTKGSISDSMVAFWPLHWPFRR